VYKVVKYRVYIADTYLDSVQYSGYLIPVVSMPRWLFWIVSIHLLHVGILTICDRIVLHQPYGLWYVFAKTVSELSLTNMFAAFQGCMDNEFMRIDVSLFTGFLPLLLII
jgi:hypothetical protein